MKNNKLVTLVIFSLFCLLFINPKSMSQGDITFKINTDNINQAMATFIDSRGMNIAVHTQNPFITSYHVQFHSASMSFQESNQRAYLTSSMTGKANINLYLISYEFEVDATVTIYGNVSIVHEQNGYRIVLNPVGIHEFEYTGQSWFDSFILSIIELTGYIQQLASKQISLATYTEVFPQINGNYFTTALPNFRIKDDGIVLWLNVNEGYLAYDNVNYTKNHHYRYLEGGMDYVIQPGGDITFTHGSNGVNLTDGFTVEEGGIFSTVFDPNLDSEGDNPVYTNMNMAGKNLYVLDTAKPENIGKPKNIPLKYELHQNYPNPFNPSTTIKYDLKNDGKVSLVIYDIIGREVIKLVDWNEEAGYKSVTWDGRNKTGSQISSGVYFYTLRTGDFVKTVKMVFVK